MIRLEYRPFIERHGSHTERFSVHLGGDLILRATRSPLYAGARELLKRGFDPEQLMTIRLTGLDHDSFEPAPIGRLAERTIGESDRKGLHLHKWSPFPSGSVQDSGEEPEA